jgi:hypothetical protein
MNSTFFVVHELTWQYRRKFKSDFTTRLTGPSIWHMLRPMPFMLSFKYD